MGKVNKKQLYNAIKNNSYSNCEVIVLGELIEMRMYSTHADIYKYVDVDKVSDNHDWDNDYITTVNY